MRSHILIALVVAALSCAAQAPVMSAQAARDHLGETATVCGTVVGVRYSASTPGWPALIDFDRPYPTAEFTALILSQYRPKFGSFGIAWRNKWVCVTGQIQSHRGTPGILLTDPDQVKIGVGAP